MKTIQKSSIFAGITAKILALVLVPILFLAGTLLYSSQQLTQSTQSGFEDYSAGASASSQAQTLIKTALTETGNLVLAATAVTDHQQLSLLRQDVGAVEKGKDIRAELRQATQAYASAIEAMQVFKNTVNAAGDPVFAREFGFVMRGGVTVPKLLNLFSESHDRTNGMFQGSDIGGAKANYMFEERFRAKSALKRLNKSSEVLGKVATKLQAEMQKRLDATGETALADVYDQSTITTLVTLGFVVLLLVTSIVLTLTIITRPLNRMVSALSDLATGNLETEIPSAGKDEIGKLGQAMSVFKDTMVETQRLTQAQERSRLDTEQSQKTSMANLANEFERSVGAIIESVTQSAASQKHSAEELALSIDTVSNRSSDVLSTSQETTVNVQTVASATEELSASVQEIGRQASNSAEKALSAADATEKSVEQVKELSETSSKIGSIIGLIQDIAEQTNLLALNATIEAARAGEAGRGFAVVASEVKSLAEQTTKATVDISDQINAIQNSTDSSAESIGNVASNIAELNEIASLIAASVEEQSSATQEIAANVQQVANGTEGVNTNINEVSHATANSSQLAGEVLGSASELSEKADLLSAEVSKFLSGIRAA